MVQKNALRFILALAIVFSSLTGYSQTTAEIAKILAGQSLSATGSITILNSNPLTGVPTAGSFVTLALVNQSAVTINVSGTYTGALSLQTSTDGGSTWITYSNVQTLTLVTTGVQSATITSAAVGVWKMDVAGLTNVRVTALAAVTGTGVVTIKAITDGSVFILNGPLPTGTNSIGNVATLTTLTGTTTLTPGTGATNLGKAKGTAAGATDTGVTPLIQRTDLPVLQNSTTNYVLPQGHATGAMYVTQLERNLATYSASVNIAPAATATDIFTITGNATTNVFITKIIISGSQTTFGLVDTQLIKRSTANSGGTSAGVTATPHSSADAAASATLLSYTANPTSLGTAVGTPIRRGYVPYAGLTSVVNPTVIFEFGDKGKPIKLIGTTQQLAVNLNGQTITGGAISISVEWYEGSTF